MIPTRILFVVPTQGFIIGSIVWERKWGKGGRVAGGRGQGGNTYRDIHVVRRAGAHDARAQGAVSRAGGGNAFCDKKHGSACGQTPP